MGGGITLAENVAVDVPTSVLQWQNRSEGTGRSYAGNGSTVPDGLTKAWQIVGIDENGQVIIKEYTDPYNGYTYHDGNAFKTVRIGDYGTPGNTSGSYDKIYFGTVADSVTGLAIGNYADNISSESTIENNSPFYSASGIAIGDYSRAKERFAIAFGSAASATGQGSMALGTAAGATGMGSVAIGRQSAATNDASLALGTASSSQGTGSVAVGHSSHAVGDRAIAIGTTSGNKGAVNSTKGTPYDEAHNTEAIGDRSIAFGIQAETTENASDSYAIGNTTKIDGSKAIGIGYQTTIDNGSVSSATDNNSIAIGAKTVIKGVDNVTEGNAVKVTGSGNVLQGSNMTVKGANNVVQGSGNNINADTTAVAADDSVVQGNDNTIVGERDLVRGSSNIVQGSHNTVDSYEGKVYGNNNIAIGESTEIGTSSQTISNGVAVGYNSSVTADGGIALGSGSVASTASGAVGYDPTTRTASTKTDAAWKSTQGAVSVSSGSDASRQIVGVAAGTNDTDAVNVAQLKANTTKVAAGTNVTVQETTDSTTGGKIYTVNSTAMQSFKVNHNGTETATIGDGSVVNFKDGTNTKAVVTKTDSGVNVQYDLGDNVATKDDGLKFAGDDGQTDSSKVISKKLNEQVDVVGGADANTLTDGNIGVNNVDGKLKVQLNKDVNLTDTGSVTIGGIKLANQSIANTKGTSETGNYLTGLANKTWNPDTNGYVSGRAATEDQLKSVSDVASAHTKVAAGNHVTVNESTDSSTGVKTYTVNADLTGLGGMDSFKVQGNSDAASEVKISDGKIVDFKDSDNLAASISKKSDDTGVEVTYDLKDDINIGKAGADGKDGTIGVNGKDGSAVVINGKDGSIGLNGKDGANGLTIKGDKGTPGLDGKDGVTRLIYETKDGETIVTHEVATLDDGMKYAGDFGDTSKVKLNKQVNVKGNAENEADLTDKNIGVVSSQDGDDGQLLIKLNKDIDLTEAGSVKIGNTDINNDGLTIHNTDTSKNITIKNGDISMGGNTITHVDAGVNDTDAVNVSQLNDVKTLAGKHTEVTVEGGTAAGTGKDDSGKDIYAGENLKLHVTDTDGLKTYDLKLADAINIGGKDGQDGHIGVNGKDGSAVVINGKDGSIGLNGKDGANGLTIKGDKGTPGLDGKDGVTRLIYETKDGETIVTHEVATLDDGMKYAGDFGDTSKVKLNKQVNVKGNAENEADLTDKNIGVVSSQDGDDGQLLIKLNKDIDLTEAGSVKIGNTDINNDGLTIHNTDTSKNITIKNGDISMGGNTITHVDAGVNDTDAVNVSQLNDVKTLAGKHTEVTVEGGTAAGTGKDDSGKDIYAGENLKLHVTDTDGLKTYDLKLADAINIGGKDGKDGHIGVNGKDGKDGKDAVAIDGKDGNEGHIGLKGKDGENGTDGKDAYSDISTHYGPVTLNPEKNVTLTNGTTAATRIHYTDQDGKTHEVATMDDGQVYGGDTGTDVKRYLNEKVNIKGGIKDESKLSEADNIGVVADGSDTLKIRLAKNLQGLDSVRIGGTKNTDGTWTGGIYIANQTAQYTKDGAPGENENGNYVIGLDNKTWNPKDKGIVSGRAATEDQLKMVQDSITNVEQGGGFGLKAEDNQTVMKNLGQTITVKGDGKNIETKVANGDVQIALKRDINVDSVTFGDKTGIKISQEGLSLGNGTTNHQITNMASGANDKDSEGNPVYDVDTNGANIGDVKNIANSVAEGVKAKSGKNITVDSNNQVNLNDHIVMGDGNGTVGSGDAAKQVEIAGSEASLRAGSGDNKVSIDGKSGTLDVGDNDNGLVTVGGDSGVKLGKQTIANHDASEPNAAEGKYLTGLENTKWDRDHIVSGRAATEDQLKEVDRKVNGGRVFKGDDGQEVTVGLGETMNLKGGADSTKLTDNNIGVVKDGDNGVAIKLSKDISGLNSITINNVDNTRHVTIQGDHIDMGGNKITNVQDGEISSTSKDAVNGSQLYQTNLAVNNIGHAVNELDNRVDRVGAGAAALAALHPLDFDPDEKWDFAAGYGNYRGADAVAVGAYYRPNEDTMFSVGGSFGGGENMVNAGVSFKIGQGNHVSTSRVAMAKEIKDLRKELENLKSAMVDAAAHREIDTSKLQLFPDVPANHWAYEYVATLAGNGIVEGYPDGNFSGDRPMTRYEFAAMLYRAMLKGAVLSDRILNEFAPELERFRVDTIYKDKNGNPTVERVRVIKRNQQTK